MDRYGLLRFAWFPLAVIVTGGAALGQIPLLELDRAAFVPDRVAPGGSTVLEIEVTPPVGWHIYGRLEETGIRPHLRLEDAELGGRLVPEGTMELPDGKRHETFGIASYWVEGKTVLKQRFRVAKDAPEGAFTAQLPLRYMICDENRCSQPLILGVSASLEVTPAAAAPVPADAGAGAATPQADPPPPFIGDNPGHVRVRGLRFDPPRVAPGGEAQLVIEVEPEPGWHFYGALDETGLPPTFKAAADGLELIGSLEVPEGERHELLGGFVSHWVTEAAELRQRVRVADDAPGGSIELSGRLSYSACDENRCLPPEDVELRATLLVDPAAAEAADTGIPAPRSAAPAPAPSDPPPGMSAPAQPKNGILAELLLAIGGGLLALAMPCTYPMIPITISFFTKQAKDRGGAVLPLALAYGGGIVGIFIAIGVLVGPVITRFAAHPVTNLVIGVVFVVFALSLFGLLNLQPPQFLMRGAAVATTKGGYLGVFLMGATLVITSFTCTAPIVGSLLLAGAGSGQDYGRVALGMGTFGFTMAVPFVLLSLLPGRLQAMPRSGEWMNTLKVTLGFVELAAALKFFSNAELVWGLGLLPRELFLTIWAAVLLCCALYLLGFVHLKGETGDIGPGRMVAGIGAVILTFYFAYGALGYRLDNAVMLAFEPNYTAERLGGVLPAGDAGGSADGGHALGRHTIVTDDFDRAVELARERNQAVLVNFTGLVCANCRMMEGQFLEDPLAGILARSFVEARLHADGNTNLERILELQDHYVGTPALPNYVIVDPDDLSAHGRYEGAFLNESGRQDFIRFLDDGLAAVRGSGS